MTTLLVAKQYIKHFISKYEVYLKPLLKLILALSSLMLINGKIGYMHRLDSISIVLIAALMCSFMPMNFIIVVAAVFTVLHMYALSLECAVVTLVLLLACKVAFAIVGGWLLDIPLRHILPHSLYGGYEGHADDVDCHEEHEETSSIFLAALRHTLEIFVFILLFSFIISLLFEGFGEEPITAALSGMGIFQPMLTALVGLVPNCAVSVLLAQLYVQGAISFGSLFAGLTAGAGVGLAVLWRVNPSWKQNLFMTGLLWAIGAAVGMLLQILPL